MPLKLAEEGCGRLFAGYWQEIHDEANWQFLHLPCIMLKCRIYGQTFTCQGRGNGNGRQEQDSSKGNETELYSSFQQPPPNKLSPRLPCFGTTQAQHHPGESARARTKDERQRSQNRGGDGRWIFGGHCWSHGSHCCKINTKWPSSMGKVLIRPWGKGCHSFRVPQDSFPSSFYNWIQLLGLTFANYSWIN